MPAIITRGAISAQGFGFGKSIQSGPPPGADGTVAIFALGSICNVASRTRNKYTYATCASTATGVGLASIASQAQSAAGNCSRGIFALGATICSCFSTCRNKYTYATDANAAAACASQGAQYGAAAGNSTRGIFQLGYAATSIRNKFTYASCASTASGVASASGPTNGGTAVGNCTRGIFSLGYTTPGCSISTTRNKYTYASCTSTACGVGVASAASTLGAAAGNWTRGIFALGYAGSGCGVATRNKYTYATCISTACGVASASTFGYGGSAAGNSTRGIFAIGKNTTIRNKYIYASCTSTACGVGAASSASRYGAGVSFSPGVNS